MKIDLMTCLRNKEAGKMPPSPIKYIPGLLHHLTMPRVVDPFSIINRYNGTDWKEFNVNYPLSLFRNDYLELMIMNWRKGQNDIYYNNYMCIHTKVLDGSFNVAETDWKTWVSTQTTLSKGSVYTCQPFSKVLFVAKEKSTTLQLYWYNHLY